jgi:predicted permease
MEELARDLRQASRRLARSPAFVVVVVATMAIGIAANATVIGIIDVAYLRTIPVPHPAQIVRVHCGDSTTHERRQTSRCSFPEVRDLQQRTRGLDGLAGYTMANTKLAGDLSGLEVYTAFVSEQYFSVLGVRPARGQFITPDQVSVTEPRQVAVLSDALWRSAFGADPNVVGRTFSIGPERSTFTVIGVAPAGWSGIHPEGRTDLWLPYTTKRLAGGSDPYEQRDARVIWTELVGRLSAGASLAEVQGSLDGAARDLAARYPQTNAKTFYRTTRSSRLVPAENAMQGLSVFVIAWLMIALLHLVACSNVVSVLLARSMARRRELGIRLCLGASRARIIALSLAEPFLLALAASVAGLVLTRWFTSLLMQMWFLSAMDRGLDIRVVLVVAGVAAATALLVGLMPALASADRDPMDVLRSSAPGGPARSGGPLIPVQVALSLVLLAQAMLLVGKYRRESDVALGYESSGLVTAHISVSARRGSFPADWRNAYSAATTRAATVAGVMSVAATGNAPLKFGGWFEPIVVGDEPADDRTPIAIVSPAYFRAIGATLASGREFTSAESYGPDRRLGTFDAAVVNETFARRHWPNGDAVGKSVRFRKGTATVIGVVRDLRDVTLGHATPRVYFPLLEWAVPQFDLVARVRGDPTAAAARLRGALATLPAIDPPLVRTIDDLRGDQLLLSRVLGFVLSACAGIAVLLTAIGLYGAVAMWAATRRTEVGIRLALGAPARHVYQLLLSGAAKLATAGAVGGVLAASLLVWLERSRYGPSLAFDPSALVAGLLVVAAATILAAWIPARRASRVSPADVLRSA